MRGSGTGSEMGAREPGVIGVRTGSEKDSYKREKNWKGWELGVKRTITGSKVGRIRGTGIWIPPVHPINALWQGVPDYDAGTVSTLGIPETRDVAEWL